MTPEERAEKIDKELDCDFCVTFCKHKSRVDLISAQIQEAVDDAYDEANKDFDWLQSAVGKIYCSLTNSKLSKWNTDPDLLIAEVEDIQNELIDAEVQKAKSEAYEEVARLAENWIHWTPDHVAMLIGSIRALKEKK